jgi:hypothetical protein
MGKMTDIQAVKKISAVKYEVIVFQKPMLELGFRNRQQVFRNCYI